MKRYRLTLPLMNTESQTLQAFLDTLASRAPTPGGGSGSALIGAVGAALCGMVGRLNDKKSGEAGPLHDTIAKADALRARLVELADADVAAFEELMRCWQLPADAPDRQQQMEAATVAATEAPLAIMETAFDVMKIALEGLDKSKKNCISDAGVAGLAAHACLEGARLNVMINLPGFTDAERRDAFRKQADALRFEGKNLAGEIRQRIDALYV